MLRVLPIGTLPALLSARTSQLSPIPAEDPHIVASFIPCLAIFSSVKVTKVIEISEDNH
jgi:hypothetical protein